MRSISTDQLRELLSHETDTRVFIDVRTPEEYATAHIRGVLNTPLDEIEEFAEELKPFEEIVVHCRTGMRASDACERLEILGVQNLVHVDGGIKEWEENGYPLVRTRTEDDQDEDDSSL
jgi:rhodanese-related sulfurtransferase